MKKSMVIVLVIAGLIALALGVRGGWAMGNAYFDVKERREASRQTLLPKNISALQALLVLDANAACRAAPSGSSTAIFIMNAA